MKIPFPPGLVFAIGLALFHTTRLTAESPSLSGAASPAASASPSPPRLDFSFPSPGPTRPPDVPQDPPFSVPPPRPEIVLPPKAPENASFTAGVPNLRDLEIAVPQVEVWRAQSNAPQVPARGHRRFELAYVIGKEPALVRLRFHPLAAGQAVVVQPGPGVTVTPPGTEFRVGPTGECVVSVALDRDFIRSDINVYCVGVKTKVPLSRASREIVEAKEAEGRGRR